MVDDVEYVTPTRSMLRRYLQRMDPYQFEQFVGDLWERFGWKTRVVGEPGDRGIDVVATATTDEGPQKQLIQAKRYGPNTTVGSPEVQQYASLRLQEDDVELVPTDEAEGSLQRLRWALPWLRTTAFTEETIL